MNFNFFLSPSPRNNTTLPEAIEEEVQLRLPPKSLFRFKCVSKSWRTQISDPCFQAMYHKQSKKSLNLLFCKSSVLNRANPRERIVEWNSLNTKTLSLTNNFTTMHGKLLNKMVTCQGMVGFLSLKENGYDTNIHLYCLTTQKLHVLPTDPSSNFTRGPIVGFGLGYLPSIQNYKVSLLFMKSNASSQPFPRFNCQVMEISGNITHGDGTRTFSNWKTVEDDLHYLVDWFQPTVFVGNAMYWKKWWNDGIISFNIESETFQRLDYPNGGESTLSVTDNICLVDLQGKLGFSVASTNYHQACFNMVIWELQDPVNHIWEKKYMITLGEEIKPCCWLKPIRPMYLQDDEIIMYSAGSLVFYNLKDDTYKIMDADVPLDHSPVGMYYESLSNS